MKKRKERQQGVDDEKKTGMKEREREKEKGCPPSSIERSRRDRKVGVFLRKKKNRTDEHWRKKNFPGRGFHDLRSRSLWWANTRSLYGRPGYLAFVNNLYFTNDVLHPSATYQGIALARSSALCTIFPLLLPLLQLPPFLTRALFFFFFFISAFPQMRRPNVRIRIFQSLLLLSPPSIFFEILEMSRRILKKKRKRKLEKLNTICAKRILFRKICTFTGEENIRIFGLRQICK